MEQGTEDQLTFAPTSKYSSLRVLLALAATTDLELAQVDIKAAYLQASLSPNDPPRYMDPPPGVPTHDENGNELVCHLQKSLYGLAAAGRLWSDELRNHMEKQGFKRTHADGGMYVRGKLGDSNYMVVFSWVDDLTLMGSKASIDGFMQALKDAKLETSSSGELAFIVNLQIKRDRANKTITLSQEGYIKNLLERFQMLDAKEASTPMIPNTHLGEMCDDPSVDRPAKSHSKYMELVGSLLYISNTCRPDITFATSQLSRFMNKPKEHHWNAAIHVLRYLKGTMNLGIVFDGKTTYKRNLVYGFADSDWAGEKDGARSTSGNVFILNGAPVSWASKLQTVTALSTAEAELFSASMAAQEADSLRNLLVELSFMQKPTVIFEDNRACIKIAENPITSQRTKHVKVKYFFVREQVLRGEVKLTEISSEKNVADIFTKSLRPEPVASHRARLLRTPA